MKISLNWLKDFVDITDIPVEEIVHKLTMAGLEVESYVNQKELYKNFVVGFVKEKQKHPKADKLSLCKVSNGTEDLQIVCGAPNVEAGQKVILAQLGTIIPSNGMKIVKTKIRGFESCGMLCSESELLLSDDHSGIKVLNANLDEGTPISNVLGLDDVIMEIGITPNRPDALSHLGVARDIAALFNRQLKTPTLNLKSSTKNINDFASIEIIDSENCPRYSAKVVLNVEIKESPLWLKQRIEAVGLRSINNIVDVTNFINFELGQPLHAFDLDKLDNKKIIVKCAEENSTFTTLDSKERKLNSNVLMICDGSKPVAIAGVMGGENSEVTITTKNILIESAYFNPKSIRRTSKFLGLSTDSSYRFERGTNPSGTAFAAERAAQLIAEISGGEVVNGIIDVYPKVIREKEIVLRFNRIEKILGYKIADEKVIQILKALDFKITNQNERTLVVVSPLFRPDIEREIDLIEEIARIDGYDNIPTVAKTNITLLEKYDQNSNIDFLREIVVGLGFNEIYCNSLIDETSAKTFAEPIRLLNPLGIEMAFLRTSLIPGALDTLKRNINVGEKNLKLFEFGNIFKSVNPELNDFTDFKEEKSLLLTITGKASEKSWNREARDFDFFDLKGIVSTIFSRLNLDYLINDSYYNNGNNIFDYYTTKNYKDMLLARGGKIKKDILKFFDIKQDVFCVEFFIDELVKIDRQNKKFNELLKFPKIHKDFAFIFDKSVSYDDVKNFIFKKASGLLKNVHIFDLFENENIGTDKKSMAFGLEFYNFERTLTDEEVEKDFINLIEEIKKEFKAVLRGS